MVCSSLLWEKVVIKMAFSFRVLRLMRQEITVDALTGFEDFLSIVRVNAAAC